MSRGTATAIVWIAFLLFAHLVLGVAILAFVVRVEWLGGVALFWDFLFVLLGGIWLGIEDGADTLAGLLLEWFGDSDGECRR